MRPIDVKQCDNVYAIYDWYDGIRNGVASYDNQLCYFEGQFADFNVDEKGLYYEQEWFKLSIIPSELLGTVLERQQLRKNYAAASKLGLISSETHRYLPYDQQRGEELDKSLDEVLVVDEMNYEIVQADFMAVDAVTFEAGIIESTVIWTTLLMPPSPSNKEDYNP